MLASCSTPTTRSWLLEAGDELFLLTSPSAEPTLRRLLVGRTAAQACWAGTSSSGAGATAAGTLTDQASQSPSA